VNGDLPSGCREDHSEQSADDAEAGEFDRIEAKAHREPVHARQPALASSAGCSRLRHHRV